jgi:addiction module RelE/StbE family toxin
MRDIKLTKQAKKKLQVIQKSHPKIAKTISTTILGLKQGAEVVKGESLQGYSEFKKIRVSKYRIIYTFDTETVTVAIIDKRETVYQTFTHLMKNSSFLDGL